MGKDSNKIRRERVLGLEKHPETKLLSRVHDGTNPKLRFARLILCGHLKQIKVD